MPRRREGPTRLKQTGYYYFDSYVGFGPDRQRVRFTLGTKDPAKAQWLWEQEFKKQWSKHYGLKSPGPAHRVMLSEIAKEFVAYERDIKKAKEWKIVEYRLNIIKDCWGDVALSAIGTDHFARLDSYLLEKGRSKFTINHYFKLLKTLFFYAIRTEKYAGQNPVTHVKPYIVDEKRRAYSDEEIAKILEAAGRIESEAREGAFLPRYAKRIVQILFLTGMRLNEVLSLRWENIQGDLIVLGRTETKQEKEKIVPVTAVLRTVLDSLPGPEAGPYVIPLRRKAKLKTAYVDNLIEKIREYSGINDFIFHNIRHTVSTVLAAEATRKGVGMPDIMKILGHSRLETTMKYLHADVERMRKAAETLSEKIEKGS